MARSVTLQQLRVRSQRLANMENSTFVQTSEWADIINANLCEVYDLLVTAAPPDYYTSTYQLTTAAGTIAYAVPADLLDLSCVFAVESTDQRRPIRAISDFDRGLYRAPQGAYTIELEYTPNAPTLVADTDTFDGVSGWEELIVAMSARDALLKEESDVTFLEGKIANLKTRIVSNAERGGGPKHINDIEIADIWPYPTSSKIHAYRLRAGNIELYQANIPLYP